MRELFARARWRQPGDVALFLRRRGAGELDQKILYSELTSARLERERWPERRHDAACHACFLFGLTHGSLGRRLVLFDMAFRENPVGGIFAGPHEQHSEAVVTAPINDCTRLFDEFRQSVTGPFGLVKDYSFVRTARPVKIIRRCPGWIELPLMLFQVFNDATVVLYSFAMEKSVSPRFTRW